MTRTRRIGGPLLGDPLNRPTKCHRRPIVTPPISPSSVGAAAAAADPARQYLLVPSRSSIDILSMENGRTVTTLSVGSGSRSETALEMDGTVDIYSVCLTRVAAAATADRTSTNNGEVDEKEEDSSSSSSEEDGDEDDDVAAEACKVDEEWIVIAACSDGTLREWSLRSAVLSSSVLGKFKKRTALGGKHGGGSCGYSSAVNCSVDPRRIFSVNSGKTNSFGSITHLSAPAVVAGGTGGVIFALVHTGSGSTSLFRVRVPPMTSAMAKTGEISTPFCLELDATNDGAQSLVEIGVFVPGRKGDGKRDRTKVQAAPFDLVTSVRTDAKGAEDVCAVAVTKAGLVVYNDDLLASYSDASSGKGRMLHYPKAHPHVNLTAVCVAPNGTDVAVGYAEGNIDIYVGLLDSTRSHLASGSGKDPMANVVIRSVHWHTHTVASIAFLGAGGAPAEGSDGGGALAASSGNLLSGGEESVLLTWSLDRGFNRPVHTLPRLAKGGIVHIIGNSYIPSNVDILVYCTDNTLRLINGYNHATKWRVQGLADADVDPAKSSFVVSPAPSVTGTVMMHDPRTRLPLLTNLPGSPGYIHWYEPSAQRVVGSLEVAPYNRISRRASSDAAAPSPNVTHLSLSESGDDMITVDTILTENSGVGASRRVRPQGGSGPEEKMSLFVTIKFWSWSKGTSNIGKATLGKLEMPYELISAMPSPHGTTGEISSLAITSDGTRACTVSFEEGSFRIWGKSRRFIAQDEATPRAPLWKCLYKIATPSGFSRAVSSSPSGGSSVAFSPDGSILAVCYGEHVTIWDHGSSSLLTSVEHSERVLDVQFSKSGADTMLLRGRTSVALQAPFGTNNRVYCGSSWAYSLTRQGTLGKMGNKVQVSHAVTIGSRKEIALALVEKGCTSVILLDEFTGKPKMNEDGEPLFWKFSGKLRALCETPRQGSGVEVTTRLVALTEKHELFALDAGNSRADEVAAATQTENVRYDIRAKAERFGRRGPSTSGAPTLDGVASIKKRRKGSKVGEYSSFAAGSSIFGDHNDGTSSRSAPLLSSELPSLSGTFTRGFVRKSLAD